MKVVFALVVIAFLKSVFAYKTYHSLPATELRRRARAKDPQAASMYKIVAHGQTLDLLLYIFGVTSAVVLVIWSSRINWWAAVITMLLIAALALWVKVRPGGWLWSFGAWLAPLYAKILSYIRPVVEPLAKFLPANVPVHAGLYEREDLLELLNKQNKQIDNRIPEEDLKIASGALTYGDKKVGSIMIPRRKVRLVSESEAIGPMLMDELHATGFSRFPVIRETNRTANPTIVGTLYLRDLVNNPDKSKVKGIMRKDAFFINEGCTLREALNGFHKTKHQLLVVVNNFEEITGVISLEDVLEQIIGQPIADEFDKYDDLRAVANIEAEREKAAHKEIEPAPEPAKEASAEAA